MKRFTLARLTTGTSSWAVRSCRRAFTGLAPLAQAATAQLPIDVATENKNFCRPPHVGAGVKPVGLPPHQRPDGLQRNPPLSQQMRQPDLDQIALAKEPPAAAPGVGDLRRQDVRAATPEIHGRGGNAGNLGRFVH